VCRDRELRCARTVRAQRTWDVNRDARRRGHIVKLIIGNWDDATNAIADWELTPLPVSRRSESSRHPLAVKS
jgi:hypothetical protein